MSVMSEVLKWFKRQVRTNSGLIFIVPLICFMMGVMTTRSGEFMSGWAVTFLLAFFSFLASTISGDPLGGALLVVLAITGEVLAICLMIFPLVFGCMIFVLGITVFTNESYLKWRADRVARRHLNLD